MNTLRVTDGSWLRQFALVIAMGSLFSIIAIVDGIAGAVADAGPHGASNNQYVKAFVKKAHSSPKARAERGSGQRAKGVSLQRIQYRLVPDCRVARLSDTAGGQRTTCTYASLACTYRVPPVDEILYRLESRPAKGAGGWRLVRTMCGLDDAPPGVPAPAVPTMGQIQTAFKQLPFSKPRVSIQPAGNVTLVNLPTYYRATWPDDNGLQPGEVSQPVKLLSWSVEFKIAPRSYTFHYGDGSSSGAVTDAGGVYPDGAIKHTYAKAQRAAQVSVDSQLTGQYRVNGGEWVDINAVADLQDEPVTTLEVQEAKARLVSH